MYLDSTGLLFSEGVNLLSISFKLILDITSVGCTFMFNRGISVLSLSLPNFLSLLKSSSRLDKVP